MSKLKIKASAVLDACLSNESPEIRAKVYEIIDLSGLDANDPMFLILALTGQMRVFLETAPDELSELLNDWKAHNARSLEEINENIAVVKDTQQEQARTIAGKIEQVSNQCVADIKDAGMAATSAIAKTNRETLAQAQVANYQAGEFNRSISQLLEQVKLDQQNVEKVLKSLLKQNENSLGNLTQATQTLERSEETIIRLQQNTIWVKFADWCSPLLALGVAGLIGFGVGLVSMSFKYNTLREEHNSNINVVGRRVFGWNIDNYLKCHKDEKTQCTFWIIPPEERK